LTFLKICKLERNCTAVRTFLKSTDSDELSYLKEDFIKIYHRIGESQWFWAQLLRTKEYGFVDINGVKDVVSFSHNKGGGTLICIQKK
jgi:hypothetical protein